MGPEGREGGGEGCAHDAWGRAWRARCGAWSTLGRVTDVLQVSKRNKSEGNIDCGCSVMIYKKRNDFITIMRLSLIGQAAL
jgi:hypothetical protein